MEGEGVWERLQESNPKLGCMAPRHLMDGPGHVSRGDLSQWLCRKVHLKGPSGAVPVGVLSSQAPRLRTLDQIGAVSPRKL